jgi:hypothetical protein
MYDAPLSLYNPFFIGEGVGVDTVLPPNIYIVRIAYISIYITLLLYYYQ